MTIRESIVFELDATPVRAGADRMTRDLEAVGSAATRAQANLDRVTGSDAAWRRAGSPWLGMLDVSAPADGRWDHWPWVQLTQAERSRPRW